MHACGHDGHTDYAARCGALPAETCNFSGTAYMVFQPAEGGGGGEVMVKEGSSSASWPTKCMPCNWPGLPAGQMAVRAGPVMAATDEVQISAARTWRSWRHAATGRRSCRCRGARDFRAADDRKPQR